jgi:choline dehydrogenase
MRKYFMRIENNTYVPKGTPGHGFDGWVKISQGYGYPPGPGSDGFTLDQKLAMSTNQNSANVESLVVRDLNSYSPTRDQETGFYAMVGHIDEFGKRSGPITYIRSTLKDPKNYPLTLKMNAHVTKVLFNTTGAVPTAIGVEVLDGAYVYSAAPHHKANTTAANVTQIFAKKEVIVSGGTFNSPQILKLSGVGPAAELKKFGIPVVKDLPGVGERLGDNYEGSLLNVANRDLNDTGGYVVAMLRTPSAPTANRNIYAFCGSFSFEGFWPGYPTDYGAGQYECAIVHMGAKSQAGYVRLRSADPLDTPDINFNFFQDNGDQDLTEILDAMKMLRAGIQNVTGTMTPFTEQHPCAGIKQSCSDQAQKEFIKTQAYSHHPTSSCQIGSDSDPLAVLDSKFRVRGVKGLRVVDASAFPHAPGAFPVLPTMILSEKASDAILHDI